MTIPAASGKAKAALEMESGTMFTQTAADKALKELVLLAETLRQVDQKQSDEKSDHLRTG